MERIFIKDKGICQKGRKKITYFNIKCKNFTFYIKKKFKRTKK